MTARPENWRMEVRGLGRHVTEPAASRVRAMRAARWWIQHRRKCRVRQVNTGECWEWRGTWIKVTPARRQDKSA